mgnify:CR=1 FL=1
MSVDDEKFNRIAKGFYELTKNEFIDSVRRVIYNNPNTANGFADALSIGQIKSKKWLIEELAKCAEFEQQLDLGSIYILCGWYGTLAYLMRMNPKFHIENIVSIDKDPSCEYVAERLNLDWIEDWRFKAITMNIHDINYKDTFRFPAYSKDKEKRVGHKSDCDTIINTSCEHIEEFNKLYEKFPKGKLLVLQSNNFDIPEHVNRVDSLAEFEEQTPMSKVYYSGELHLDLYTRFMRIGFK